MTTALIVRRAFAPAVLVACAVAMLLPVAALAAPTDIWQTVGVAVHDLESGKTPTLVIVAQARPGLTPPVEAAIAIPKGAELSWAGELLGGDPNDDPTLEVTIDEGDTYDLVRFTLVNSPRVQLELTVPADMLVRTESQADIDLAWTSAGPLDGARLAVYVPADAHMEDTDPALSVEAIIGQGVVYSVEATPVAAGQTLTLSGLVLGGVAPEMEAAVAASEDPGAGGTATDTDAPAPGAPDAAEDTDEPLDLRWLLGVFAGVLAAVGGFLVWKYHTSQALD